MADWIERYRGFLTVGLLVALVIGAALWWERRPVAAPLTIATPATALPGREHWLIIDVVGAVASPGIYSLPDGSRVADAIDAAGGAVAEADLVRLNRAAKLRDEQQVRVPYLAAKAADLGTPIPGSVTPSRRTESVQVPSTIDLNAASVAQLDTLPGIGPVTSQRIIAYRDEHGPFNRIEQLREAKLVTAAVFEQIKGLITTN